MQYVGAIGKAIVKESLGQRQIMIETVLAFLAEP